MNERTLMFESGALKELKEWLKNDRKIALRIIELCEIILKNPFRGIGKPEPLRHNRQGFWSRRITKEHRLIYKVTKEAIIVIACKYHYD